MYEIWGNNKEVYEIWGNRMKSMAKAALMPYIHAIDMDRWRNHLRTKKPESSHRKDLGSTEETVYLLLSLSGARPT